MLMKCVMCTGTDTRVFRVPSFRTKSRGQCSFSYQAPLIWNQLFLSAVLPLSALLNLPWKLLSLKTTTFLHSHCPEMRLVCVCVHIHVHAHVCVCVCVCARTCVGLCVFMLHALNFDNIYFMCKHWGHVWVRCSKYSLLLLSLTSVV